MDTPQQQTYIMYDLVQIILLLLFYVVVTCTFLEILLLTTCAFAVEIKVHLFLTFQEC